MTLAPLGRRLLSLVYEIIVLAALVWIASLLFAGIEHGITEKHARTVFQLYVALLGGAYYVWQWTHGGQTLPMKTWRLKVISRHGGPLSRRQALVRYLAALAGALALGVGFVWALVDRDRQFLHDRVAGTLIVRA